MGTSHKDSQLRDGLSGRAGYQPRNAPSNHVAVRTGFAAGRQRWRGHWHRQRHRLSIISLAAAILLLIFAAGCQSDPAAAPEQKPDPLDALYQQGLIKFDTGDLPGAIKIAEQGTSQA